MRKSIEELTQLAIMVRMRVMGNYPMPGDAVCVTDGWDLLGSGQIGIISGIVGKPREYYDITFNASAFRGKNCPIECYEYVSCSGGPGTIATPAWKLRPTNEKISRQFWGWKDFPRRDGGVRFYMEVPLFEWDGKNE